MTTDLGPIQRPRSATLLSPVFPSYATVKKDGIFVRWVCTRTCANTYTAKLYSRTGHLLEGFDIPYFKSSEKADVIEFDSECIGPEGMSFQELNGVVRAKESSKKSLLSFYAFDYVDKLSYAARLKKLRELVASREYGKLRLIEPSIIVVDPVEIKTRLDLIRFGYVCATAGEEGLILKDTLSGYTPGKTWASQKIKFVEDDEFLIVDVWQQTKAREGCALFVCQAGARTFTCTLNATVEEQRMCYDRRDVLIGKYLTVEYLSLSTDGVPRQPKGKGIRIDQEEK